MSTELLPYRLKSARRKKRLQKSDYDKKLLRLERRLERIKNSKEVIMEKLDQPYQRGWKRLFVLTKEVAQSPKAEFYQGILDKINEVQYHFDESFKRRGRGNRWHRRDYKELPKLRTINTCYRHTNMLNLNEEQLTCFKLVNYWNAQYYRWEPCYEFAEPWLFEINVLPHIIYKVKVSDALIAQVESFLNDYLYGGKAGNRLAKIKGGWRRNYRYKPTGEKAKYNNPLKNQRAWEIAEEYC